MVSLGLLLLLVLALSVVLLPEHLAPDLRQPDVAPSKDDVSKTELPAVDREADTQAPSAARLSAEETLRELLRLRARLELARAPEWGEPEWSDAKADVTQGDRLFTRRDFSAADAAYSEAISRFRTIESTRTQRLESALELGAQALDDDRHTDAVDHFEYALAIDAEHADAVTGMARAKVRAQVLELMNEGAIAEERGELATARTAYDNAIQLDEAYIQAAEARRRVDAQIEQRAFDAAMSEAIQALDQGRYAAAEQSLNTAAGLQADNEAVRDLRLRLAATRKQSRLAELDRMASTRAAAEDWQAAVATYDQALKLDANATFAVSGIEHARARLHLHGQIDHYLGNPARLTSDEPLANAERVLLAAGKAPSDEPVLADKLTALREAVVRAKTPVRVELKSDGQTDVVIYRVGRQGRFLQQQLELRPGTYTAVGSRAGYRDVRRQFVVEPGPAPVVVSIRCEETI